MIKSFKCKETEGIFNSILSKKLPKEIQKKALIRLLDIDKANDVNDLKVPPSNRLHPLGGDRKGQYSISINMQWRICFTWKNNNALDVEIIDYH